MNMQAVIHEEKLKPTRRQVIGVALWAGVLPVFAALGAAWYWLALIGANLLFEVWNLISRMQTSYVLTLDSLILKRREAEVMTVPLSGIQGVFRGTFRELLKNSALKEVPAQRIRAVPKLGGSKEVVALIYEAEGKRAVFIQPSLALQLVLEQGLGRPPVAGEVC